MQSAHVAIVGGGPIGIELAVGLKRAGIDYLHFEANQVASAILAIPPRTQFFSHPEILAMDGERFITPDCGHCRREQYLAYLLGVIEKHGLQIREHEPVSRIERADSGFKISTPIGEYSAHKIVLTTGGANRPRRLNVPGEDLPHVSHYLADPQEYIGKRVVIVGGSSSAHEAAIRLSNIGGRVTLVYRKNEFARRQTKPWLMRGVNDRIARGEMTAVLGAEVYEILRRQIILKSGNTATSIPADSVLLLTGTEPDRSLIRMLGIQLSDEGRPNVGEDSETMETSVPGVYVAGCAVDERFFVDNGHTHVRKVLSALQSPAPAGR